MERAADAAMLAWQYKANSALKRALYELVRACLFRQTGSEEPNHNAAIPIHYSWLVQAREELMAFWMEKAIPPEENTCAGLRRESKAYKLCAISRGTVHVLYKVMVHDSGIFLQYRHDPMVGLQALIDAPWVSGDAWPSTYLQDLPVAEAGSHICVACANRWRVMWQDEKKGLWNNLDAWLGLDVVAK